MAKRLFAAFLGLGLALLALPASATPPVPCGVLGCGDDLTWAQNLETKIKDNMWWGQVFEIDKDPATGAITSVNHFGDSALWTGTPKTSAFIWVWVGDFGSHRFTTSYPCSRH